MKDYKLSFHGCPWCGEECAQTPLDPETSLPLDFVCEDCGSPIYFCSLSCAWQAELYLLKAKGLPGKEARRLLLARWKLTEPPPAAA